MKTNALIICCIMILLGSFEHTAQGQDTKTNTYTLDQQTRECLNKGDYARLAKNYSEKQKHFYDKLLYVLSLANIEKSDSAKQLLQNFKRKNAGFLQHAKLHSLTLGLEGIQKYRVGKFLKSLAKLDSAAKIMAAAEKNEPDKYFYGIFLRFLGRAYSETGLYLQGVSYLEKSNIIFTRLASYENISVNYKYIGRLYQLSSKHAPDLSGFAMDNYRKALAGFKKYGMGEELPWLYSIISDYYLQNADAEQAKLYQDSALALIDNDDKLLLGLSYNNFGRSHALKEQYNKAENNYNKALKHYKSINNHTNRAVTYYNLAHLFKALEQNNIALSYADSSLTNALEAANADKQRKAYDLLSKIFYDKENFREAFIYFEKANEIQDSLVRSQNFKKAYSYKIINETLQKEEENQRLSLEAELKEKEIARQRQQKNSLIIAIAAAAGIGIVFYLLMRKKNIEKKAKEKLQFILQGQETEKNRIAQELHDGISGQITGMYFLTQSNNHDDLEKLPKFLKRLKKDIQLMARDLYNPLERSEEFPSALKNYINRLCGNSNLKVSFYHNEVDFSQICLDVLTAFFRIIQEALHNTHKHADAKNVWVQVQENKDELSLSIEDDGQGFDPKTVTPGTGMKSLKARSKSIGGDLTFDSRPGNGTAIYVKISKKGRW